MDVIALEVFYFLARLFVPMWCGGLVLAIITAVLWNRGERGKARARKTGIVLAAVGGSFLLFLLGSAFFLSEAMRARLESLRARPPARLVLSSKSSHIEIKDPEAIGELLDLIARGEYVLGHHSYPVDRIVLSFPDIGYAYTLGKDSQRENEFWLNWVAYPGSGKDRDLQYVRQFRSSELQDWLQKRIGEG